MSSSPDLSSVAPFGLETFEAILYRDYNWIMAVVTLSAVLTMLGVLLANVLYAIVDPRMPAGRRLHALGDPAIEVHQARAQQAAVVDDAADVLRALGPAGRVVQAAEVVVRDADDNVVRTKAAAESTKRLIVLFG